MRKSLQKIQELYDSTAEEYADFFSGEHEKKPKDLEMLGKFARGIEAGGPVWDLGCGPGHTACLLNKLGLDASGLDLSAEMIKQAQLRHPGIHFQTGNILDLEFDDNTLCGATALYAIVHFNEQEVHSAFCEIHRVLRPGGLLLCTFHMGEGVLQVDEFLGRKVDGEVTLFPPERIIESLKTNGFTEIEVFERAPCPDIEYQSRRAYVFARK